MKGKINMFYAGLGTGFILGGTVGVLLMGIIIGGKNGKEE